MRSPPRFPPLPWPDTTDPVYASPGAEVRALLGVHRWPIPQPKQTPEVTDCAFEWLTGPSWSECGKCGRPVWEHNAEHTAGTSTATPAGERRPLDVPQRMAFAWGRSR